MKFNGRELRRKNIAYLLECNNGKIAFGDNFQARYTMEIVKKVLDDVDDYVLDNLYDTYKGTSIGKIFVIDIKQFEHFLEQYLPTYINEINKEMDEKVKKAIELRKLYFKEEEE